MGSVRRICVLILEMIVQVQQELKKKRKKRRDKQTTNVLFLGTFSDSKFRIRTRIRRRCNILSTLDCSVVNWSLIAVFIVVHDRVQYNASKICGCSFNGEEYKVGRAEFVGQIGVP